MLITHFSNSFIVVESEGLKVCCDPWVGKANYGGWHSYPEYKRIELCKFLDDVDLVYISHLHEDHFDPQFLKDSGLVHKKFIIKSFELKILLNRIKGLGVHEVLELNEFEIFNYEHLRIAIFPQMASNSSDLDDYVHFDLDTSIIINDGETTFFNQVDNPFSTADYKEIKEWINEHFGDLHVAALMAGAAGEYPQAFFNIDRGEAKKLVIDQSLIRLKDKLLILNPECYFPAGGTYFLPGKFSVLNKYIAQPGLSDIQNLIQSTPIPTTPFFLEGGRQLEVNSRGEHTVLDSQPVIPVSTSMRKSIEEHKFDKYDYELEGNLSVPEFKVLEAIFEHGKKNWESIVNAREIEISQQVKFILYENLLVDDECKPEQNGKIVGTFDLNKEEVTGEEKLIIHMDIRSFFLCLIRKKVWNGTLGSLCLFERIPNVFYPSVTFSLNYLVVTKEELAVLLE
jgi:UDP-MurNAc hydroxylase